MITGLITDPRLLAKYFRYRTHDLTYPSGSQPVKILGLDATRIVIVATLSSSSTQYIRPASPGTTASGIMVPYSQAPLILTYRDLGGVIGAEWYWWANPGNTMYLLEICYRPIIAKTQ